MRSVGVLLLALCGGVAEAQDLPPAERAPRFLLASADASAPRAVDVRRTPMLRRRISVAFDGVTLREALSEISRQGNIPLMYSADDLPLDSRVRLRADSISVAGALSEVLLDAGVDVLMSADGRAALVRRAPVQVGTIVGRVTDARAGTGLEQATVWVEGTSLRATTQVDGAYRIADVPSGTQTVSVRRLGYRRQSQTVVVVADQEVTADFALEAAATTLDEVVVTGTMVETARKALPSPITVITADEIREQNVQRVDQLFRGEVPGVFSFDEELSAGISRVFVRGGSSLSGLGEVKTYVDGVQVAAPSFLSTIDPGMIDRVELIRGPQASTIYGSQALNGVLQIFTKKGVLTPRPTVEGSFTGGMIQTRWADPSAAPMYRSNLTVAGGAEGFSYSVGGTRVHKGEWVTGFRDTDHSFFGSFRASQAWLTAEFSGRLHTQNRTTGVPPYYMPFDSVRPVAKQQQNNYQTTGVGVTLRVRTTSFWEQTVTIGAERFLQEFVTVEPAKPGDSLQTFTAELLNTSLRLSSALQGVVARSLTGSVIAGVDLNGDKSTNSGGTGPYTIGNFPKNVFAGRFDRTSRGYFVQGQLGVADRLFLTAGLRAEKDPYYGADYGLAWAPRVGVSYVTNLGRVTLKPRFSYGKSIRPPSPTARLGSTTSTQITLPNPNVGPESQQGFDAGIELYAGARLSLQATYYDQNVDGLIDRVIRDVGPPQVRIFENIGEVKNRGVELEASLGLLRGFTLRGTYSLAESEVRQVSPDYTGGLAVGDQLPAVPKHTGGASLRYVANGWTASLGARSLGTWNHYNLTAYYTCLYLGTGCRNTTGNVADYRDPYPGFTKFRMSVSRQLNGRWTARLDVENLTNDYSVEELDTNTPIGRVATFGFDFRL
jgi:outer membrane receptor protein involved in Fe transport